MIDKKTVEYIKQATGDFLGAMGILDASIAVSVLDVPNKEGKETQTVSLLLELPEPQILIGQNGQTLFELQRILRMIFNKHTGQNFYVELDINHYKEKKTDHIKNLARDAAKEVAMTKEKKVLPSMSAYERRIIHAELQDNKSVVTESQGEGADRVVVITPR